MCRIRPRYRSQRAVLASIGVGKRRIHDVRQETLIDGSPPRARAPGSHPFDDAIEAAAADAPHAGEHRILRIVMYGVVLHDVKGAPAFQPLVDGGCLAHVQARIRVAENDALGIAIGRGLEARHGVQVAESRIPGRFLDFDHVDVVMAQKGNRGVTGFDVDPQPPTRIHLAHEIGVLHGTAAVEQLVAGERHADESHGYLNFAERARMSSQSSHTWPHQPSVELRRWT